MGLPSNREKAENTKGAYEHHVNAKEYSDAGADLGVGQRRAPAAPGCQEICSEYAACGPGCAEGFDGRAPIQGHISQGARDAGAEEDQKKPSASRSPLAEASGDGDARLEHTRRVQEQVQPVEVDHG